jgi:hypothetical protein
VKDELEGGPRSRLAVHDWNELVVETVHVQLRQRRLTTSGFVTGLKTTEKHLLSEINHKYTLLDVEYLMTRSLWFRFIEDFYS